MWSNIKERLVQVIFGRGRQTGQLGIILTHQFCTGSLVTVSAQPRLITLKKAGNAAGTANDPANGGEAEPGEGWKPLQPPAAVSTLDLGAAPREQAMPGAACARAGAGSLSRAPRIETACRARESARASAPYIPDRLDAGVTERPERCAGKTIRPPSFRARACDRIDTASRASGPRDHPRAREACRTVPLCQWIFRHLARPFRAADRRAGGQEGGNEPSGTAPYSASVERSATALSLGGTAGRTHPPVASHFGPRAGPPPSHTRQLRAWHPTGGFTIRNPITGLRIRAHPFLGLFCGSFRLAP